MKPSIVFAIIGLLVGLILGVLVVLFGAAAFGLSPEAAEIVQPVTSALATREASAAQTATTEAMPTPTRTPRPPLPTATPTPPPPTPTATPSPVPRDPLVPPIIPPPATS